jgi:hypothetical protein
MDSTSCGLSFSLDFNCQIGTSHFTQLAANAVFDTAGDSFFYFIQLQDMLGTKRHANTTPLAPILGDYMFLEDNSAHCTQPFFRK